jgi:phosphatidylinositol mannoside-binding LppM-like protein
MSRWVRALVLGALPLVCAGCLRYNAQLRVDPDGTVSGSFVTAVKGDFPVDLIEPSDIPSALRDKVGFESYAADGYVGARVDFDRLTMAELSELFGGGQRSGATVRLSLARDGDALNLSGALYFPDLSMISGSNAGYDTIITFSFPGADILASNGRVEGTQVSWSPAPGQILNITARAVYPPPAPLARPAGPHTGVAVFAGVLAILIGVLALVVARLLRRPELVPAAVTDSRSNPYAGTYPSVPSGPGLSPESIRRRPDDPPED